MPAVDSRREALPADGSLPPALDGGSTPPAPTMLRRAWLLLAVLGTDRGETRSSSGKASVSVSGEASSVSLGLVFLGELEARGELEPCGVCGAL
mmetsp:Transcript_95953/g.180591  ORF Transcript_95953/g.180591 Transcript_95953/m.180591 type:complete len:94 (-) Transcript_95953:2511-2792(-)